MQFWKPTMGAPPQIEVGAGKGLVDRIRMLFGAVTISTMDPFTISLWSELSKGCKGNDDLCELEQVFYGLRNKFEYRSENRDFDVFRTLRRSIENGSADCDCATVALCSVLSCGEFVVGARCYQQWIDEAKTYFDWNHVAALVMVPRTSVSGQFSKTMTLDLGVPSHIETFPGWHIPMTRVRKTADFWYRPQQWYAWYARQDWSKSPSDRGNILHGMPKVYAGLP